MTFFELILSMIAWAIQIGAVLVIATVIGFVAVAVEQTLYKRSVKRWPRTLAVFLLLCAMLAALAVNPPVVCTGDLKMEMTDELHDKVRGGADGLYSWRIPLVPVCAEITGLESCTIEGRIEHIVKFSVYYFCFGVQRMEYSTYDGYNAYPMFGQ